MLRLCFAIALFVFSPFTPADDAAAEPPPTTGHHHEGFAERPDAHGPIGVMGDHMHKAGEWMASYRYGRMRMSGNRDSRRSVSSGEVLGVYGFGATPVDMDMEMHMFGLMGAPTDWLTGMVMLPYLRRSMDHRTAMGGTFRTRSDGVGDLTVNTLWRLFEDEIHHVHLNLGMSFPTGTIRDTDDALTPTGPATIVLPFPMQLGSGTFDWLPGVTYVGHSSRLSWGGQAMGTIRTGKNSSGWAASDTADVTAWLAMPLTEWMSASLRAKYQYWSNYRGNQTAPPPPTLIPTADPRRRGGQRVALLGGFNFNVPLGDLLGKQRFGIEFGGPLQQWLEGPQLETSWQLIVGWQKAF